MDRREKIICKCNLGGKGLEIGPSISPVVPKKDGFDIEIINHTDKKGLIDKYTAQGLDTCNIEEVDYVWTGESYAELTGKRSYYDYIIASHVIEHTCDLIVFLCECSEILKENGILSLAIPDKRYCFDYLRPATSVSKVLDRHINSSAVHSPGSVYEHYSSVCCSDGAISWDSHPPREINAFHEIKEAVDMYNDAVSQEKYIDVHSWVFTKSSFELLIYDLNCLDLIDLVVTESFGAEEKEFFISLMKRNEPFKASTNERLKLAINAKKELEPTEPNEYYAATITELNAALNRQNEEINRLKQQIIDIYDSKTYKTGDKIRKVYRLIKPEKPDRRGE